MQASLTPTAASTEGYQQNLSEQVQLPTPVPCPRDSAPAGLRLAQPAVSSISFATKNDATGWPTDARLQFTTAISRVQASFSYNHMHDNLTWERVWYFGNQELT
ncbi:MAG: hypothetical protein R3264_10825, partial [Anaerolineae bacterium]|nr:hypothetical protein [Anaerolineae bacterium]